MLATIYWVIMHGIKSLSLDFRTSLKGLNNAFWFNIITRVMHGDGLLSAFLFLFGQS